MQKNIRLYMSLNDLLRISDFIHFILFLRLKYFEFENL